MPPRQRGLLVPSRLEIPRRKNRHRGLLAIGSGPERYFPKGIGFENEIETRLC
jgi:hypothetical protein